MRYLIQIVVMIIEVAVPCVAAFVLISDPSNPFIWLIIVLSYLAWQDQGGFMAWQPKNIKKFLNNAKQLGL